MTDDGVPSPSSESSTALAGPPPAPPVPAVPAPATALRPAATALPPRPPSPLTRALSAFWAEREPITAPVLVGGLAVGVAGGALVVGHRPGLGAAVVALLVAALATPAMVRRHAVGDLVSLALAVALVGVLAVRDAGWVVALSLLTAAGVGAMAVTSARSAPAVLLGGLSWLLGALRATRWVGRGVGALAGSRRGRLLGMGRSVLVTVVLLTVFGLLFASADAVFASYLPRLEADLLPGRVVVGLLVLLVALTAAHLAAAPPGWSALGLPPGRPVGRAEWLLPVLALDALVVAFVLVQVGALVGGHRYVLATAGLSYATYAREGFAQLVAVTALTLVVIGVAARRAPRGTARDRWETGVALAVLCVGTLGVVASALRRMDLYVEAFGLTRLRVLVVVAEVAMAVVLVLVMAAGVRWRGAWLPRAVVQVVAVATLVLAAVNPDALIVRHNTTADLAVALDVGYLQGLSADAVPAMAETDEPWRSRLLTCARVDPDPGWAGWNLGRDRAADVLADADLPGFGPGAGCERPGLDGF